MTLPGKRRIGLFGLCALSIGALLLAIGAGLGFFVWNVQRESNSAFLRDQLLSSLEAALGKDNGLAVDGAALSLSGVNPVFSVSGLAIRNEARGIGARLEQADLTLRSLALWRLSPEPTGINFDGLRIIIDEPAQRSTLRPAEVIAGVIEAVRLFRDGLARPGAATHLESVAGRNIAVLTRDAGGGEVLLRDRLSLSISRKAEGVEVQLAHPDAPAPVLMLFRNDAGAGSDTGGLIAESMPFTFGSLGAVLGVTLEHIDPAFRLKTVLRIPEATEGAPGGLDLVLSLAEGMIRLPDKDIPPFRIRQADLALRLLPGAQAVEIRDFAFTIGEANIHAKGRALPQPDGTIRVELRAERPSLDRLTPGESVVTLDWLDIEAVLAADFRSVVIERFELADGPGILRGKARLALENGGLIETELSAQGFDLRRALRIWPVGTAPQLRNWLIGHALGGTLTKLDIKSALAGKALEDAFAKRPLPDEALLATFAIDQGILRPLGDAAMVQQAAMDGRISGRKSHVTLHSGVVETANGKPVQFRNAQFVIADTGIQPTILDMTLPFSGRIDGLLAVLAAPSLKARFTLPGEVNVTDGQIEGTARITLRLVEKPGPRDIISEIRAEMRNVVIDQVIKGEKLEGGVFSLQQGGGITTLKGNARVSGVATQIEMKSEGPKTEFTLTGVLDDGARARRGADMRPVLTGPVATTMVATIEKGESPDIDITLDLSKAKVEGIVPGFVKRPGQPAKASFGYNPGQERGTISDLELDLGSISARGDIDLGKDGQFLKAELALLRLSPGDNVRAGIERLRGGGLKIALRGNAFDMRPFLKGYQSGRIEDAKATDLDLDIQTTVLVGFNNELISAADVQAQRRGGQLSRLAAKGRFGASALSVETRGQQQGGNLALMIDSADAGALFRFMDIYPRMFGGRMTTEVVISKDGHRGLVQVRDFIVRGEPLLRQYAGSAQASGNRGGNQGEIAGASRAGLETVRFTKLRADFLRRPGSLDVNEAVMWGNEIGGTLEGRLDYAGDRVDLKGTLVPAYALNNLFSQLPLLGPIFGGSQYEGLFALPFVISGRASAPLLRTNALSVVAPGFLRKVFEFQREGAAQPSQLRQSNPR